MRAHVALLATALWTSAACSVAPAADAEQTLTSRDTSSQFVVEPARGVIMGSEHVPGLLRPCGREVPSGLAGYWTPDAQTLTDLETRLPGMLDFEVPPRLRPYRDRIRVARQYVGLMRHGRRVVYVNGWPDEGRPYTRATIRSTLVICGGGRLVFGVLYDPETRTFSHFAGNGPI